MNIRNIKAEDRLGRDVINEVMSRRKSIKQLKYRSLRLIELILFNGFNILINRTNAKF